MRICTACSAVFVSPLPSQSEVSVLYAGAYYRHHPAGQAGGAFLDDKGRKMIDPDEQAGVGGIFAALGESDS